MKRDIADIAFLYLASTKVCRTNDFSSYIMSAVEYNSLLFEISQRLDNLDVGRKLLVMCRGKVAHRNEENM